MFDVFATIGIMDRNTTVLSQFLEIGCSWIQFYTIMRDTSNVIFYGFIRSFLKTHSHK